MITIKRIIILFLCILILIYLTSIIYNNFNLSNNKEEFQSKTSKVEDDNDIEANTKTENMLSLIELLKCSADGKMRKYSLKKILEGPASNHNLRYIMDGTFGIFKELESIDLSNKKITALHLDTFINNTNLKNINFKSTTEGKKDTPIGVVVSDFLLKNMNVSLGQYTLNEEENSSEKYKLTFGNNPNGITVILTKDTLERLNSVENEFMKRIGFNLDKDTQIEENDDISKEIVNFLIKLKTDSIINEDHNKFAKLALGVNSSNLKYFELEINGNKGDKTRYPINFVWYKDMMYETDCGLWRKQYLSNDEIDNDKVLNKLCITLGDKITHILEIFRDLFKCITEIELFNKNYFNDLLKSRSIIIERIKNEVESLETKKKQLEDNILKFKDKLKDHKLYLTLLFEFISSVCNNNDCKVILSDGEVEIKEDSLDLSFGNCDDDIRQQLKYLDKQREEDPNTESKGEEHSAIFIPHKKVNFCKSISNYDLCNEHLLCKPFVDISDQTSFICEDKCHRAEPCDINNCISYNNECISKDVMFLKDSDFDSYHINSTYPVGYTFPATALPKKPQTPEGTAIANPPIKDCTEEKCVVLPPGLTAVSGVLHPFIGNSKCNTQYNIVYNGNIISFCSDSDITDHKFYGIYHLEEEERFRRMAIISKNFAYSGDIAYFSVLDKLMLEANYHLINNSAVMMNFIKSL